jgi:hypothetical protein
VGVEQEDWPVSFDGRDRWAFGLGLGILVAVGTGILAGNQTAAEMDPFYANLTTAEGSTRGTEIVDASFVAANDALPDTSDLSYGRGRVDNASYSTTETR